MIKFKLILFIQLLCFTVFSAQSQQCKPESITATTPTEQFTMHQDGTVTDIRTGLMWKQCIEGLSGADCLQGEVQKYNWEEALQHVTELNNAEGFSGYKDWRVPNIKELRSIVERQCYRPAINLVVFPNTPNYSFWSSSPWIAYNVPNRTWFLDFNWGDYVDWVDYRDGSLALRLVRAGF